MVIIEKEIGSKIILIKKLETQFFYDSTWRHDEAK